MKRVKTLYWVLSILLVVSCVISMQSGAVSMGMGQIASILLKSVGIESSVSFTEVQENIFWTLRMPRILFAVFIGVALGASGVALQGIFRNPLVDSGLIGIASG